MFLSGFSFTSYDYYIYVVFVVCVPTGTVTSKGKTPAVKEKAQVSHLQNHPDKNLLVRC